MIKRPSLFAIVLLLIAACGGGESSSNTQDTTTKPDETKIVPCTFDQLLQCNDGNPCTQDRCIPNTFACKNVPEPMDGSLCDPKNLCVEDAACQAGACVSVKERDCLSTNPCKPQICDPQTGGCIFAGEVENNTPCDDSNLCTTEDTCEDGVCVGGEPPNCDDGNPCTTDECEDPNLGCVNLDEDGSLCDDNNPCTVDSCDIESGECSYESGSLSGQACSTGNPCKGEGTCEEGECKAPTIVQCDDENPCTFDKCDSNTGECVYDGTPMTGVLCNDNNPCTDKDRCNNGVCKPGPTKSCNDFNPCTQDVCYQATACCSNSYLVMNNVPCDDGNPCTETGTCFMGSCSPGELIENCCTSNTDCSDNDPCTEDVCNNNHCVYLPIPEVGCCGDTHLKKCTPAGITHELCEPEQCGWSGADYHCGGDGQSDPSGINPKSCPTPECIPQCGSNECGPDGCGGTCGTCANGEACGPAKLCIESLSLTIDFSDPSIRNDLDPNGDGIIEEETEIFLANGVQIVVTTQAHLTDKGIESQAPFCFEGITLILPNAIAWSAQPHDVRVLGLNTTLQLNASGLPLGAEVLGLPGKVTVHYWADEQFNLTEVSEHSLSYWAEDGAQELTFETPATLRLLQLHFGENGSEYQKVFVDVD